MTARRPRGTPEENDAVRTAAVLAAVQSADPSLSPTVVADALRRAAPAPFGRAIIAAELDRNPAVLVSGRPDSKAGTQRLIKELVAAGSTRLSRPHCTICRRVADLDLRLAGGGRACMRCSRMLRETVCPGCHELRLPFRRQPDGPTLCARCANADGRRWDVCSRCGRRRPVAGRAGDQALCQACLPRDRQPCQRCGVTAPVHSRLGGEPVCASCAHEPQRICVRCRYPRPYRADDPGCQRCGVSECVTCRVCGDTRFAFRVGAQGCFRCRLHRHVDRLIVGADPDRVDQLGPFLDGLRRADDPKSGIQWLSKPKAARPVLEDMLHGRAPVSHDTLDAAAGELRGKATSIEYLRRLLVNAAVLPPRDEQLSRLERTIALRMSKCPAASVGLLRQYATWKVLPDARSRSRTGRPLADGALAAFTAAHNFLVWLDRRGIAPQQLEQGWVDVWVADRPSGGQRLAPFLTWARRRRLIPPVTPVPAARAVPSTFPAADQLVSARRCLTDQTLPAPDRLAGALLLLFGQSLRSITLLTASDIQVTETSVHLALGPTPLHLPDPLADLARSLLRANAEPPSPGITRAFTTSNGWLFPGRPASRPLTPVSLRRRLVRHLNIPNARSTRNTALLTLAGDVPPVVLADLLGISVGTAERWRELAAGNWALYAATRTTLVR